MKCPSRIVRTILLLTLGACVTFSSTAFAAEKLLLVQPAASNPAPWHEDLHIALDDALSRELKISSRVDIRYSLNEALLTFSCERATPACMRQVAGMFGVAYIFWTEIQGTGPYEINVQGVHGKRTNENYSLQYTFNSKTAALRAVRPFVAALIAGIPYEGRNLPGVEELASPQADEDVRPNSSIPAEQTRGQTASTQRKWPLRLAIASGVVGLVSLGVGSYYGLQDNDAIAEMEAVKKLQKDGKISASEYENRFRSAESKQSRVRVLANINFMGIAPIAGILMGYGLYEHFRRDQPQVSLTHEGIIFTSRF